jgi:hypothetical protein
MTALGRAASRLNLSMIKLLLEAGADPKALDDDHRTARERLPEREMTSAQIWDAAAGLLAGEEKPHG